MKKPTPLPADAVTEFAEGPSEARQAHKKEKAGIPLPDPSEGPNSPKSGLVPEGDVRLSANIDRGVHLKLKIAAAEQRTTIGELIEKLVNEGLGN